MGCPVARSPRSLRAAEDEIQERLRCESRLAASLDHPNVIRSTRRRGGRSALHCNAVCPRRGPKALLRREGALDPTRAVAIFEQIADALDAGLRHGSLSIET